MKTNRQNENLNTDNRYSSNHRKKDLKNFVYEDLLDKIIHCIYPPGTELNELMLTQAYNISRTPIREAVARLEVQGYLKVLPKKGIYVTDVTLDTVLQIFQARLEIEPIALMMAIPYLDIRDLIRFKQELSVESDSVFDSYQKDMEMHLYFIRHCHNHYIIDMMQQLFLDNTRTVIMTGQNKIKIHTAADEHIAILNHLIQNGSPSMAAELLRNHIESCRTAALEYFSSDVYLKHHDRLL